MIITCDKLFKDPQKYSGQTVEIAGWVRSNRNQKEFGFLVVNDGSAFASLQIVYADALTDFAEISKLLVGTCVAVRGTVKLTPAAKQPLELVAEKVTVLGACDASYPIQPKRHTREFLRQQAHLRMRTNLFNAVFRVRSLLAFAIHDFFRREGFIYCHSPIITANDGEGAGNMFQVTTLDLDNVPKEQGTTDYRRDFFGKRTNLTVTGQLEAETFALAFGKTYTFGPTFRAELSHTQIHAAEFWMIEPEIAFADLHELMKVIEQVLKYAVDYVLKHAPEEMAFFDQFVAKGKLAALQAFLAAEIAVCPYTEALKICAESGHKFENDLKFGDDLDTEHEKYLTEVHFKAPVFIIDWPKDIKAFYMRLNDDGKTVAAVDLIVPGAGELLGGSQREERLEKLIARMDELGISREPLDWYLDLRRYGGCVHSGFGIGFERLVMFITGIENIRDVAPFPRTPKNCEF